MPLHAASSLIRCSGMVGRELSYPVAQYAVRSCVGVLRRPNNRTEVEPDAKLETMISYDQHLNFNPAAYANSSTAGEPEISLRRYGVQAA